MKVRYIIIVVALALIISGVFFFTQCRQEKAKITGISVKLVSSEYTMKNNTIKVDFGDKVVIGVDDFKVTEIYSDGQTKVISPESENNDGYEFKSTIPDDGITPAGEYSLVFKHSKFSKSVKIKIIVEKAVVDISSVMWNYNSPFTFDGEEKEVKVINLPSGVSVTYEGDVKATNAGIYTAIAIFTHTDENNYEQIQNKTLTWEILPSVYEVQGTAKLKDEYKNLTYKGSNYTVELDLSEFNANYVRATIDTETITAKNVGKYFARVNLEYIGTNTNYNRLNKDFVIVEWKIEKAPLKVSAKQYSISYGDNPSNNGVTFSGFVGSDTVDVLSGTLDFDYSYEKGDNVGEYSITPKGLLSQNYNITFISGSLIVDKVKIDFKDVDWVKNISYTYSGNEIKPVLNYQTNEFVGITYLYTRVGGGNNNPINVGTYKVSADIVILNNNYEIVNNHIIDYEYTIIPKNISVAGLVWTELDLTYSGNSIKPTIANSIENVVVQGYNYTKDGIVIDPIDAGTYVAKAILVPENNNYKLNVDFVELVYNISAKIINCSQLMWQEQNEYEYDGLTKTPELIDIPEGVDVSYAYKVKEGDYVNYPTDAKEYIAIVDINVVSDNYKIVGSVQEFGFRINPKKIDCSSLIWLGNEEYVLGEEFAKPVLINLPTEVKAVYEYFKSGIVVEEILEAGEYVASVTLNPINSNYVVEKYPTNMQFNFVVKEPEVEKEIGVKLVIDGVEYKIYNDGTYDNLEYDPGRSVYNGKISTDYLFSGTDRVIVESIYVFKGKIVEDVWGYREIELTDGYAENFWIKLSIDSENPSIALAMSGYGLIILTCEE